MYAICEYKCLVLVMWVVYSLVGFWHAIKWDNAWLRLADARIPGACIYTLHMCYESQFLYSHSLCAIHIIWHGRVQINRFNFYNMYHTDKPDIPLKRRSDYASSYVKTSIFFLKNISSSLYLPLLLTYWIILVNISNRYMTGTCPSVW